MHGCYAEACRRAEAARKTPPETTCAYPRCQAGGVILEGAPRKRCAGLFGPEFVMHPGCLAAKHRESEGKR